MANNNDGQIVLGLDIPKTVSQINADIKKLQNQLEQVKATGALDTSATVKQINAQITSLQSQLKEINLKTNINTSDAQKVGQQVGQTIANATQKEIDKLNQKCSKIELSTDLTKLTTDYQKFGVVSQEVENNLKELKLAQEAVVNAKGTDRLATEIEKYNQKLTETKSSLKELTTTQVSMNQRTSQMTSMQEWMRKNKAATKLVGNEVNKLIEECKTCDAVRFNGIKNEFKELQVQAGKAGKLGNSLLGSLVDQAKRFTQWIGVSGLVMQTVQSVRQMKDAVIDVNSAMIELRKVSDASDSEIKNYFDEAAESAKRFGSSVSDMINATADWSRLGYNLPDSKQLAEVATLYKNVGDGIDIDAANQSLISTLQGFQLEAKDAMNIIDQFNEVDILAS